LIFSFFRSFKSFKIGRSVVVWFDLLFISSNSLLTIVVFFFFCTLSLKVEEDRLVILREQRSILASRKEKEVVIDPILCLPVVRARKFIILSNQRYHPLQGAATNQTLDPVILNFAEKM
jgi:hypothetical protein